MIEHLKFKDVEMTIGEDSDVDLAMTFNTINRWLVSKKRLTIGKLSDGTHTFDELYRRITYLTAAVVNSNRLISWKSKRDDKGDEGSWRWMVHRWDRHSGWAMQLHLPKRILGYFRCPHAS